MISNIYWVKKFGPLFQSEWRGQSQFDGVKSYNSIASDNSLQVEYLKVKA